MCGRYRLTSKERYLRDHFGLEGEVSWTPRWNIAPTQQDPVVRRDRKEPKRSFALLRWGLIPFWAKDASIGFKTINAMSETDDHGLAAQLRIIALLDRSVKRVHVDMDDFSHDHSAIQTNRLP
jgi:putative SOS response-associated peptidase YedK